MHVIKKTATTATKDSAWVMNSIIGWTKPDRNKLGAE